jgi:release factor glutamine methyltransferase
MIISSAVRMAGKKLKEKNIESADLEAEIFLSFILRQPREFILAHPEIKLNFWQKWKLNWLVGQRIKGIPVAYLIGHKEFYGLDFLVNKNVLIPRPETELMVEEALKKIINYKLSIINFIDVGTGSGCIIVSLAKMLKEKGISGNFFGLDISKKALKIARKNAKKNNVDGCIHFLHSDLLNITNKNIFNEPVIITANLPYLTPEQVENSPSIQKEPKIALLSGIDGLNHYRSLFRQINERAEFIKSELYIFCEIDETQKDKMTELIKQELPRAEFEFKNDLGGHCRLAKIKF